MSRYSCYINLPLGLVLYCGFEGCDTVTCWATEKGRNRPGECAMAIPWPATSTPILRVFSKNLGIIECDTRVWPEYDI